MFKIKSNMLNSSKILFIFAIGGTSYIGIAKAQVEREATLKICKVAGEGVALGTSFEFDVNGAGGISVPAGPGPGGYCSVVSSEFEVGDPAIITETGPLGYSVSEIVALPLDRLDSVDLEAGVVGVTLGTGVTEVTYTNERRFGYVEICKYTVNDREGQVSGDFTFTLSPSTLGPITVPVNSCSPALEVPAGDLTVTEIASPGGQLADCGSWPSNNVVAQDIANNNCTFNVRPGGVEAQTLIGMGNAPNGMSESRARRQFQKSAPYIFKSRKSYKRRSEGAIIQNKRFSSAQNLPLTIVAEPVSVRLYKPGEVSPNDYEAERLNSQILHGVPITSDVPMGGVK